jgi:hypothetical protein
VCTNHHRMPAGPAPLAARGLSAVLARAGRGRHVITVGSGTLLRSPNWRPEAAGTGQPSGSLIDFSPRPVQGQAQQLCLSLRVGAVPCSGCRTLPVRVRNAACLETVTARWVGNCRLADALHRQAFSGRVASPGARSYYDRAASTQPPPSSAFFVATLISLAFITARSRGPLQRLTSCLTHRGDGEISMENLDVTDPTERLRRYRLRRIWYLFPSRL